MSLRTASGSSRSCGFWTSVSFLGDSSGEKSQAGTDVGLIKAEVRSLVPLGKRRADCKERIVDIASVARFFRKRLYDSLFVIVTCSPLEVLGKQEVEQDIAGLHLLTDA